MADRNKFEEMLERLINEDQAGAEELFHEIVVEKSRDIYESLLEDDLEEEDDDKEDDDKEVEEAEEKDDDDDKEVEEGFDLEEFEVEADDEMGGDMDDDMMGAIEMGGDEEGDDMGDMGDMDDEGEEGDVEDRVEDLEDALDELKAEFEKMMAGEEGDEEDDSDDIDGMDDEEDGMDGMDDAETEEEFAFEAKQKIDPKTGKPVKKDDKNADKKSSSEEMREYVEKVTASMGDTGTNGTKSSVAGKNDMGGTASNLNQAGTDAGVEANKGNLKGSALSDQSPKDMSTGNVNVPGGKASKSMKAQPAGHGAEKKGKPDSADKGAVSTLNKVSTRAK